MVSSPGLSAIVLVLVVVLLFKEDEDKNGDTVVADNVFCGCGVVVVVAEVVVVAGAGAGTGIGVCVDGAVWVGGVGEGAVENVAGVGVDVGVGATLSSVDDKETSLIVVQVHLVSLEAYFKHVSRANNVGVARGSPWQLIPWNTIISTSLVSILHVKRSEYLLSMPSYGVQFVECSYDEIILFGLHKFVVYVVSVAM